MTGSKKEGLKVFVRVRPPISDEIHLNTAVSVASSRSIHVNSDKSDVNCSYDHVFNEVSNQAEIFSKVRPLLGDVLSGYNACIFAYGQTTAGKSYTMLGPNGGQNILNSDNNQWGILPRSVDYLFGELADKADQGLLTYQIKASFLQIYNENLYDLLRESGPMIDDIDKTGGVPVDTKDVGRDVNSGGLKIREIPKGGHQDKNQTYEVYVSGLSEFRVQTADDVLRIIATGTANRTTRSTDFNLTSSRSHAILQLTFEIESFEKPGQTVIYKSKLSLVDLAGSEKMTTLSTSESKIKQIDIPRHIRELTSINKSLSSLGNVIAALSSSSRSHVPYRDSKLTRLLQDSLGGNTRTILVACVAPTINHAPETISTLQFADRAKSVMLKVKANTVVDDKEVLARAYAEIERLKMLLKHALKSNENGGSGQINSDGFVIGSDGEEVSRLMQENSKLKQENLVMKIKLEQSGVGGGSNAGREDKNRGGGNDNRINFQPGKKQLKKKSLLSSKSQGSSSANSQISRRLGPNPSTNTNPHPNPTNNDYHSSHNNIVENNSHNVSMAKSGLSKRLKSYISLGLTSHSQKSQLLTQKNVETSRVNQSNNNYNSQYGNDNIKRASTSPPELNDDENNYFNQLEDENETEMSYSLEHISNIAKEKILLEKQLNDLRAIQMKSFDADADSLEASVDDLGSVDSAGFYNGGNRITTPILIPINPVESSSSKFRNNISTVSATQAIPSPISSPTKKPNPNSVNYHQVEVPVPNFSQPSPTKHPSYAAAAKVNLTSNQPIYSTEQQSSLVPKPIRIEKDNNNPGLSYSQEDIGIIIQMFSFRFNSWDNVELTDFEVSRNMHKCKLKDGTVQWLDLKKKPIRAFTNGYASTEN